jgi:hypothetical protein
MVGCHLITEEEAQAIMAMANIDKAPEGDK